jgi:hypothetical protein
MQTFASLPQDIQNAHHLICEVQDKVRSFKTKIKQLEGSPEYIQAVKVMQSQGESLRVKLQAEMEAQFALLKALKPPRASAQKSSYSYKIDGQTVTVLNEGKTLVIPLNEVKYSTALIGNADGQAGKVQTIGITFQQGKALVGAILGK